MKKKTLIFLFLSCIIALLFMERKSGFFIDELYTYGQSNTTQEYICNWDLMHLDRHIGKDFKPTFHEYLTVQLEEKFCYNKIPKNLNAHPPLCYWILHTVMSFYPNYFSKWFGLGINLFIYILLYFALISLGKEILKNDTKSLYLAFIVMISPVILEQVVYIRGYLLLTLFSVILVKLCIKYLQCSEKKYLLGIVMVSVFGGLTHYYFFLVMASILSIIGLFLLIRKKIYSLYYLILTAVISICFIKYIFPNCIEHIFFNERKITHSAFIFKLTHLKETLLNASNFIVDWLEFRVGQSCIILLSIILCLIFLYIRNKEKKQMDTNICVLCAYCINLYFLKCFAIDYSYYRYYFDLVPFLIMVFFIFIFRFMKYPIYFVLIAAINLIFNDFLLYQNIRINQRTINGHPDLRYENSDIIYGNHKIIDFLSSNVRNKDVFLNVNNYHYMPSVSILPYLLEADHIWIYKGDTPFIKNKLNFNHNKLLISFKNAYEQCPAVMNDIPLTIFSKEECLYTQNY